MDPLTIGFENALHAANERAADAAGTAKLVRELQRIIDVSSHRAKLAIEVSSSTAGRIELRTGKKTFFLEHDDGRWHMRGSDGASFSGPVAAALTALLTSDRS